MAVLCGDMNAVLHVSFLLKMADLFCNSVGILQQSTVDGAAKTENMEGGGGGGEGSGEHPPGEVPPEENIKLFSNLITRTAQDIDTLIDSLPSSDYTAQMQVGQLIRTCLMPRAVFVLPMHPLHACVQLCHSIQL